MQGVTEASAITGFEKSVGQVAQPQEREGQVKEGSLEEGGKGVQHQEGDEQGKEGPLEESREVGGTFDLGTIKGDLEKVDGR